MPGITIQGNIITINWLYLLVFIVITVLGAVWTLIQVFGKRKINNYFDERLKKYQQNLDLITEKAKFDYTRMNLDFNLWTTKRHEVYAKFYTSLTETLRFMSKIEETEYLIGFEFIDEEILTQIFKRECVTDPEERAKYVGWNNGIDFVKENTYKIIKGARVAWKV